MDLNKIEQKGSWGEQAANLNQNFARIDAEMVKLASATGKLCGYFTDIDSLSALHPAPVVGMLAYIGKTSPYAVYICKVAGKWESTGESFIPIVSVPDIVQKDGNSTTSVMSQAAVAKIISQYDVSASNGGAKYALQEAIDAVPVHFQKGGLSVKFVDSVSGKYVNYICKAPNWTTDTYKWQEMSAFVEAIHIESKIVTVGDLTVNEYIDEDGNIKGDDGIHMHTEKIPCENLVSLVGKTISYKSNVKLPPVLFFDRNDAFVGYLPETSKYIDGSNIFEITDKEIPVQANYCYIQGQKNIEGSTKIELTYHTPIQQQINSLNKDFNNVKKKIDDTIHFGNIFNREELTSGSFTTEGNVYTDGGYWTHSKRFAIRKGMRIVGKDMVHFKGGIIIPSIVFFDADNHMVGWIIGNGKNYSSFDTAEEGMNIPDNAEYFVYNTFSNIDTNPELHVYYKEKDIVKSSIDIEYKEEFSFPNLKTILPNIIYNVANDIVSGEEQGYSNNQNTAVLYLDNFFYGVKKEFPFTFKNGDIKKIIPFISNGYDSYTTAKILDGSSSFIEEIISDEIIGNSSHIQSFEFIHRCIKNSATKEKAVNILFVGDSITYGQNAYFFDRKELMSYSMILHDMFEIDRINNKEKGFSFRTIGVNKRSHILKYKTQNKSLDTFHEGYQGKDLESTLNSSIKYDLASYLNKYRTCDDEGKRLYFDDKKKTFNTPGNDNIGYYEDGTRSDFKIGSQISNVTIYDVFKPTHIFLFMGTNGGYTQAQLDGFINGVKEVDENIFVGIGLPHWGGTIFPSKHRNFIDCETWKLEEHKAQYDTQTLLNSQDRNTYESRGVYFLDTYFVSPGVLSAPCGLISEPFAKYDGNFSKLYRPFGEGANLHVSSYAHAAYAYQIYGWIKWTIAKNS